MGEEPSEEARWLRDHWGELGDFNGRWIAVRGAQIIGAEEPANLESLFTETSALDPLYAFVWLEGL